MVDLIKAAMFLFPFLKELFLGKGTAAPKVPPKPGAVEPHAEKQTLNKFLLSLVISSVVANVFLIDKLFTVSGKAVAAKRELAKLKEANAAASAKPVAPPEPIPFRAPPSEPSAVPNKVDPPLARPQPPPARQTIVGPSKEQQDINNRRLERIDGIR